MNQDFKTNRVISSRVCRLRLRCTHRVKQFLRTHKFKGSHCLLSIAEKALAMKPKGPTITPTLYGFDLIVDPTVDKGVEQRIFSNGTYEAGILYIFGKCLNNGDTFIDVGANIGLMSLFASNAVGEIGSIHSFEPEPDTFAILRKNIDLNKAGNIKAYNIALGAAQDTATIYTTAFNRGAASLMRKASSSTEGTVVSISTLDEFVREHKISNVGLLKIDVEGWELEILKGAKETLGKTNAPILCIEYSKLHPVHGGKLSDIYDSIVQVNDYKIYKLDKGKEAISKLVKIGSFEELPSHDNLFCFLPIHLRKLDEDMFA